MDNITEAQIEKIKDEGEISWYDRTFCSGVDYEVRHRMIVSYQEKQSEWHEYDKFILHPELFGKSLPFYLSKDLPQKLAVYVRNQFTGSSERITIGKISEVCALMVAENPAWWHPKNRGQIFLDRFRLHYPGCCDGKPPKKTPPPAGSPDQRRSQVLAKPNLGRSNTEGRKSQKKEIKIDLNVCLGLIMMAVLAWLLLKWLF